MLISCTPVTLNTEVTSNGVTWTFNAGYETGTFVTGDPWVVAPSGLTVNSVSPGWDGTKNGSMVNPANNLTSHGYDSRATAAFPYDGTKRATFPLSMSAGQSLISTIGKTTPAGGGGATRISAAAVLTVLATAPASTAFRPPYVGTTKTIWTTADVDYDLLPGLAVPSGATVIDMSASGNYMNKVWLSHGALMSGLGQIHPEDHMGGASASGRGYGDQMSRRVARMAMGAMLDIPEAQSLANRLIQYGIDQQANMAGNGDAWIGNGGHGGGRKFPILFAKAMLDETWTLPTTGVNSDPKFQEDGMTYLGAGSVARWGWQCDVAGYHGSYSDSNHNCRAPSGNLDSYELYLAAPTYGDAGLYETSNTATSWCMHALAARLMETSAGLMTAWGNAAFFDYADRWVSTISVNAGVAGVISMGNTFQIDANRHAGTGSGFMKAMWETYR